MARRRRAAVLAVWIAFLARGTFQVLSTPIWEGFDEPFHVAYIAFVAEHGRPPGYQEPSFPLAYDRATTILPNRFWSAPGFQKWRQLGPEERAAGRALAATTTSGIGSRERYGGENYERQQPPLFYYLAAPVAWLLRRASLPQLLVALRLFCVLLASLVIPLTARLARLLLPQRGVLFALPIAALLPNTLFFVDRVTNDALAWPILAAISTLLVLSARRPSRRRFQVLGLLVVLGVWTKMTLLPALPAALLATLLARRRHDGRRAGDVLAAVGLPAVLIAPLFFWNVVACGNWSGITYSIHGAHPGLLAALQELGAVDLGFFLRQWIRNHLWAGGWEFLQPSGGVYRSVVASLLVAGAVLAVTARQRGKTIPGGRRWLPLFGLAAFFVSAMLFHVLVASAVGRTLGQGPVAGAEGWYFDVLRPIEACAAAALLCAAIPARRTRGGVAALMLLLVAADAAGTLGLLLPHWAGLPSAGASPDVLRQALEGARQAAPLLYPPALAVLLAAIFLVASACLIALGAPAAPARRLNAG